MDGIIKTDTGYPGNRDKEHLFFVTCYHEGCNYHPPEAVLLGKPVFRLVLTKHSGEDRSAGEPLSGELHFSYHSRFEPPDKRPVADECYVCVFDEAFLSIILREKMQRLPVIRQMGNTGYLISGEIFEATRLLFQKMVAEQGSSYMYKSDLIRTYITQIFHVAMKIEEI